MKKGLKRRTGAIGKMADKAFPKDGGGKDETHLSDMFLLKLFCSAGE